MIFYFIFRPLSRTFDSFIIHQTVSNSRTCPVEKETLFELPLGIYFPPHVKAFSESISVPLVCRSLCQRISVIMTEWEGHSVQLIRTAIEQAIPTATFISKSRNPEPDSSLSRMDYVCFAAFDLFSL